MSTVSKEIADRAIAGEYEPEDPPVLAVVVYNNVFNGGESYGLCYYESQVRGYFDSEYCINPRFYYERNKV